VQGLQGTSDATTSSSSSIPLVAAACKHFLANSLERWGNTSRHSFDAHISKNDLHTYYLVPFRECTKHAAGVMCSYNAINGMPVCANEWLLSKVLRGDYGFDGYVVSDCGALEDIVSGHHAAVDATQAAAMALNATVDLNCGDVYSKGLQKAYEAGMVDGQRVDEAFRRLAQIQFRLGLFDSKDSRPPEDIRTVGAHSSLAYEAALRSVVLLQNKGGILPLNQTLYKEHSSLAMIGPHIHAKQAFLSNYHGQKCGCGFSESSHSYSCILSPLEAFSERFQGQIFAIEGCHIDGVKLNEIKLAQQQASTADVVVLVMGLDQSQEREELDRNETTLPGLQVELVQSVLAVAAHKTILVLIHGGALSLSPKMLDQASAIVSSPYGGQEGASAIASVLFGEYNPTGKLSATMYNATFVRDVPLTDMSVSTGIGRTHLYYKGTPQFPFGHGLSYSNWELDIVSPFLHNDWDFEQTNAYQLDVNVTNVGPFLGSQTVLLLLKPPRKQTRLLQKLVGFEGTGELQPGESQMLSFQIESNLLEIWRDALNTTSVEPGDYQLEAVASNVRSRTVVRIRSEPAITSAME